MIKIHDIKPNVVIPDFSIYIYYGLILFAVLVLLLLIYLIYKYINTKFFNKKQSNDKQYYQILKNINFQDTKKSAYLISKYGKRLVKNQRDEELLDDLNHKLEVYKYKKDVPDTISDEIKVKFETFKEALDVR